MGNCKNYDCENCEDEDCKQQLLANDVSMENTEKFLTELISLATFANEGKVHPILKNIIITFTGVVEENIHGDNDKPLIEFHDLCCKFGESRNKELNKDS